MSDQVMTSTRFLSEGTKFECVCCGQVYFDHTGHCNHCQAPTSISRVVAERDGKPKFLCVLGASGAGKTVYLGMLLDMLTKGTKGLQGLPNNSFSVSVQQQTMNALERRRFPEKTATESDTWKWIHCEVNYRKKKDNFFDIITPDFAGEAISEELENPGQYPAVGHIIRRSQAVLVLVDSIRVRDLGRDEDFFALKLLSYLESVRKPTGKNAAKRKTDLPVAIVLTKSDACPEAMQDPAEFARHNLPGVDQYLNRHFNDYQFFAVSAVGASVSLVDAHGRTEQIPMHIEPLGIVEPFEWIIKR
ncbi:MAG: hypothetical protein R3C28_04525 [Pirellulaceae bacterium]